MKPVELNGHSVSPRPLLPRIIRRFSEKKAATLYNIPEREIVLGEITVGFYNELNGVVRGWQAKTIAGRRMISE